LDPLTTAEVEVMKVVEDNVEAERNGDVGLLEHNLSDNFLGISPTGFVMTKEDWLAGHSSSNLRYSNLRLQEKKFRMYGSKVARRRWSDQLRSAVSAQVEKYESQD